MMKIKKINQMKDRSRLCLLVSLALMIFVLFIGCIGNDEGDVAAGKIVYSQVSAIESGQVYVLSMKEIKPDGYDTSVQVAMKTSSPQDVLNLLDYQEFTADANGENMGILWIAEEFEGGYSLRAADADGNMAYLNMTRTGSSSASLSLGEQQAFDIQAESSSAFTISQMINGTTYYVRFTNSGGSGFTGGTTVNSTEFSFYKIAMSDFIDLPPTDEEPLFTVVATSDTHTDYGIQNNEPYVRQGYIDMAERVRQEENANVLLLAGDITSKNSSIYGWTKEIYDRAINKIYEVSCSATKSGRTLYATGNHDFVAGGASFNSGNYTAPMLEDIGAFEHVLLQQDSPFEHILGYHYNIDGMDFVVMNTAYTGTDNHSNYVYEQDLIDWVDKTLEEIGAEKTVFVMGHYPLQDSRNISSAGKGISATENNNDNLKSVLLKYSNAIYLYGHDHGGHQIQTDTFERVTPYTASGGVINSREALPTGFITSFVGSMAYYTDSLGAEQPEVVQALVIDVYSDKITFEMKNYGISHGELQILSSYSIPRETAF